MRRRKFPVGLAILLIIAVSVGIGFLGDALFRAFEYRSYPRKYSEYVGTYTQQYNLPEDLVYAVIRTESGFDSSAESTAGAVGLMQLTEYTFTWITNDMLGENLPSAMRYDPETNIRYGCYLLSKLYGRYENWDTACAAYNAGIGNVDKWLEDPEISDENGNLVNIPFAETREYLKRIDSAKNVYRRLYYEE